jgi:hypothetical protein
LSRAIRRLAKRLETDEILAGKAKREERMLFVDPYRLLACQTKNAAPLGNFL